MNTRRLNIRVLAALVIPLFLTACGGSSKTASTLDSSNADKLGGLGSSTTTTDTSSSLGGLFDNDLSGDTASTTTTSTTSLGSLSPTESECLNGSTSSSSTSDFSGSLACLSNSANSTGTISDQAFFQAGISSFGQMNTCRQLVMQAKPAAGASQAQVAHSFYIAKLAMIRCIRNLMTQQAGFLPWNQTTQSSYSSNDNILWGMLQHYAK